MCNQLTKKENAKVLHFCTVYTHNKSCKMKTRLMPYSWLSCSVCKSTLNIGNMTLEKEPKSYTFLNPQLAHSNTEISKRRRRI